MTLGLHKTSNVLSSVQCFCKEGRETQTFPDLSKTTQSFLLPGLSRVFTRVVWRGKKSERKGSLKDFRKDNCMVSPGFICTDTYCSLTEKNTEIEWKS